MSCNRGRSLALSLLLLAGIASAGEAIRPHLKQTDLYRRTVSGCDPVELTKWTHPAKAVLEKRGGAALEWAELCNSRTYPILGVRFEYDPRGQTADYFRPLYLDVLQANGGWPLSFVSLKDNLIVNVKLVGPRRVSVSYEPYRE